MKREVYVDLDKVRSDMLREKVTEALDEFKESPNKQWAGLKLSKPLLEKILLLLDEEVKCG